MMLDINLRHLYFFSEVARLGSVTAAADSIHLSQPAITQAIANTERFFGTALLHRTPTGVTLTGAGLLCQQRMERAFVQLQEGIVGSAKIPLAVKRTSLFRTLSTSQLDALLAVVDHGNFSAAARARGVSQPTIHRATHHLERILNLPLFEKTSHGVVPTRDAERLARKIKLAVAEVTQAKAEIDALHGGESGRSIVGALALARTFILPNAVMKFSEQFPHHQIEIVEGTYEHLVGSLRHGELDFFIGAMRNLKSTDDIVEERLFEDPLSIVMRSGHPLLSKKRVAVRMLADYPWVAPRPSSPLRNHFNRLFKSAGVKIPFAPIECNSISAARALLLESDRVMLLSAHQIYYDLRAGLLATIPPPLGKINRLIGITSRRNWQPTKTQASLLNVVRATVEDLPAGLGSWAGE